MKEKFEIKVVNNKFSFSFTIDLNHFYYLPFIGWIYPLAFKKDNSFAMDHAKQGFVMMLFFTLLMATLSFSTIFIHTGHRVLRLIIAISIYLAELIYFSLCVWGTVTLVKGKQIRIPAIKKFADRLNV